MLVDEPIDEDSSVETIRADPISTAVETSTTAETDFSLPSYNPETITKTIHDRTTEGLTEKSKDMSIDEYLIHEMTRYTTWM